MDYSELSYWIESAIDDLEACYLINLPDGDFGKLQEELKAELSNDPEKPTFAHMTEFQERAQEVEDQRFIVVMRIIGEMRVTSTIKFALHHCYLAQKHVIEQRYKDAVHSMITGTKFAGIARGYMAGIILIDPDEAIVQMAKAGARGRDKNYQPLRDFVTSEVEKRSFRSKRNAAMTLKPKVLALARELEIPLSEPQAEKTITGWLSSIPFASKRTPSTG